MSSFRSRELKPRTLNPKNETPLYQLASCLTDPFSQSLLRSHPNDIRQPHESWAEWWAWSHSNSRWREIAKYYYNWSQTTPLSEYVSGVPPQIRKFIDTLKAHEMNRLSRLIPSLCSNRQTYNNTNGMSPKKLHEVDRMIAYMRNLIASLNLPDGVRPCFIDGYLTRALRHQFNAHVLALDGDDSQTKGAESWERKMASKRPHEGSSCEDGSITHRTLHVNAASLMEVVNDWITGLPSQKDHHEIPIVLVALHACGSLTPDTLRAFIEARRQRLGANDASHGWQFVAAVVVGCCYNLLRVEDFPLSRALKTMPMHTSLLSPSAYHLATHVPSHWFDTMKSSEAVALSVRKVVWRALLGRALESVDVTDTNQQSPDVNAIPSTSIKFNQVLVGNGTITQRKPPMVDENGGMGSNPLMRRFGRLPDSAYQDWATFIEKANQKLGVTLDVATRPPSAFEEPTETQLETLYILRCLLGPVIETLLVRDRIEWIQEQLATDVGHANIQAVNLFDQASGSGRNVALVITS